MADLNDNIDLDVYRQLNTSSSSFDGFTECDISNAKGHPHLDLSRQLDSSFLSSIGFSQSDINGESNSDDGNASVSHMSSDLEYGYSENESQDEIVESSYNSHDSSENESDEEINPPGNNSKSDYENSDSSSSGNEFEENINSDDTESDSIDNHGDNLDLDGVANKHGMPDELFELLNQPINWNQTFSTILK